MCPLNPTGANQKTKQKNTSKHTNGRFPPPPLALPPSSIRVQRRKVMGLQQLTPHAVRGTGHLLCEVLVDRLGLHHQAQDALSTARGDGGGSGLSPFLFQTAHQNYGPQDVGGSVCFLFFVFFLELTEKGVGIWVWAHQNGPQDVGGSGVVAFLVLNSTRFWDSWVWVNNGYPKWVALVDGTKLCSSSKRLEFVAQPCPSQNGSALFCPHKPSQEEQKKQLSTQNGFLVDVGRGAKV